MSRTDTPRRYTSDPALITRMRAIRDPQIAHLMVMAMGAIKRVYARHLPAQALAYNCLLADAELAAGGDVEALAKLAATALIDEPDDGDGEIVEEIERRLLAGLGSGRG